MEHIVCNHLQHFSDVIKSDLKTLAKMRCQAKCANGKQCKFEAKADSKCCKKHAKVIINTRDVPSLIYHNHLPGQKVESCPACQTVGINS